MSRANGLSRSSAVWLLRHLPEAAAVRLLRRVLIARRDAWGFGDRGPRIACALASFRRAYPDEEPGEWLARWQRARFDGAAASLVALARMAADRPSRLPPRSELQSGAGPTVVAFPHTVLDPLPQMSLLAANPELRFLWPNFPLAAAASGGEGRWDDDRVLWTAVGPPPERLAQGLVPITDPRWLVRCLGQLRQGGAVFLAMDVAFEAAARRRSASIAVGEASVPLAPAIEMAVRQSGARLCFLHPVRLGRWRWEVRLQETADVRELAALAGAWIAADPLAWAGWPFLACRESVLEMRRGDPGAGAQPRSASIARR